MNTAVKSYTSTREITHDITPVKGVGTKVKLIVEYCCENTENVQAIIDLPMSKFMDDDHEFKDNFNEIVSSYLKKSVLFLKNTTAEERGNIHQAIQLKDYTITGVSSGTNNDIVHMYVDNDSNEYIQDYFCEYVDKAGGYDKCEFITFIVNFPILAIGNQCYVSSPFRDDPPVHVQQNSSVTPDTNYRRNITTESTANALVTNRFAALADDNDDEDVADMTPSEHPVPTPISTKPNNSNWRHSPTPVGPWKHASVYRPTVSPVVPHPVPIQQAPPAPTLSMNQYIPTPGSQIPMHNHQHPSGTPNVTSPYSHVTTPDLHTFDLTEYSITNTSQYCDVLNSTKMDLKHFMKKEYMPTQNTGSLLNWYRRLTDHGLRCGVFIPPFESLIPMESLGLWINNIDPSIVAQVPQMSSAIHAAIVNCQSIPPGPAFTEFLNTTCGYSALHDLMRDIHPRLAIHTLVYDKPKCKPQEHISDYIVRWKEYLLIEHEDGRRWRRHTVAKHIINNLPKEHRLWIQSQFDALMLSKSPHYEIPPAFHMNHISKTITTLIPLNPNPSPTHHHHHRTSHALHSNSDDLPDTACAECSFSHAFHGQPTGDKHCPLCDTTTHNLLDCHKYINYCLCHQYAKTHGSSVTDILRTHKHPPPKPVRSVSKPRSAHALVSTDLDATTDDDSPDDDDPPTTSIIHSLGISHMNDYNEESDECDPSSTDIPLNRSCISSIGFDFDTSFATIPLTTVATAEIVDTPIATIVHSVENDTQEILHAIGGQFDSGANMNTTNLLGLLWNVHKLKSPRYTVDAGQNRHAAHYRGYLVLPCTRQGHIGHIAIATYYTPSIGVTLIAPSAIRTQYTSISSWTINDSDNIASATFYDTAATAVFAIPLYSNNNLHWTAPFVRPSIHQRQSPLSANYSMSVASSGFIDIVDVPSDDTLIDDWSEFGCDDISPYADENVSHPLHSRTLYQIWHQRLGHIQPRTITDLHKHVDGIPTLPTPTLLDNCPVCITSKMRRADSSPTESREATQCHQSLSIDMAFIVQKSKNSDRYIANVGLKGETCYVLITDYYSGMVHGKALVNKGPPIEFFNQWLARFNPDITNKTVRFDQGGELGRCRRVIKLFQDFGYTIQLTGADSSHQNGSVERSHQTIGNMVRSLLHGASLDRKFWPYAFYHSLFIMNRFPHSKKPAPPITMCSGRRISLEALRVFGCRIYVRLPGERRAKLDTHTSSGIFLGYNETMKNIVWYDPLTDQIKTASHVRFDEGMSDVPDPPPNVKLLQRIEHDNILPDAAELSITPIDFQPDSSPFRTIDTVTITILCDSDTFGFVFRECHLRHRAYISDILPNTSASRIRNARNKYIGAFVV